VINLLDWRRFPGLTSSVYLCPFFEMDGPSPATEEEEERFEVARGWHAPAEQNALEKSAHSEPLVEVAQNKPCVEVAQNKQAGRDWLN